MKKLLGRSIALLLIVSVNFKLYAQDNSHTADLVKQGTTLRKQGSYADAVEKFNEALKTGADNAYANYELAFTLYAWKKPDEAVPYLEKAVKADNPSIRVAAWCLLAGIYDEGGQPEKAIAAYNAAITIRPDYPDIYYNLGLACFRNKQYAEAETSAIEAIKHDPKNAGSQRLYALVCFHQNKRMNALLSFCSFILMEPNTARSAEAYGNIQHILQGGTLKESDGRTALPVQTDKESIAMNTQISLAVASAKAKKLTGVDLLEYELKTIFITVGQLSEKKTDKTFFDKFFAEYLYKLAQSDHMPSFTKMVIEHKLSSNDLDSWEKVTERVF